MSDQEIGHRLGGLAAERDPLLRSCFVRSEVIQRVLTFGSPKNIVVGKKGSGKSAAFLVGRGPGSTTPVIRISPSTHLIEVKRAMLSHTQYADIMRHELSLECLKAWSENEALSSRLSRKERLQLAAANGDYVSRLKKLGARIEGGSAFGWGVKLGESAESSLEIVSKSDTANTRPLIDKLSSLGGKCLVMVDDPELLFGYSDQPPANLLGGLLLASVDLTTIYPDSIRIVVFLKLHVYRHMKRTFEDIDHLRHNFEMLKWVETDLEALLAARLIKALALSPDKKVQFDPWLSLLRGAEATESAHIRSHVLERLVCGPRDLIWFSSQILDMQARGYQGWEALLAAEANYSQDQLNQLELEYGRRGYEEISSVVSKLFSPDSGLPSTEMKAGDFEEFLRSRLHSSEIMKQRERHDWLEALTPKSLAQLLYEVGVLGYWLHSEERFVMPYEISSETRGFLASPTWRLNPAFNHALGIAHRES